jgi:hypothetical protein
MKNGILLVLLLSVALVAATSTAQDKERAGSGPTGISEPEKANHKQAIESKIAGLRPGRDSIGKAYSRFHKDRVLKDSPPNSALWWSPCTQQTLTVSFDTNGVIWEVKIEPAPQTSIIFDCDSRAYSRSVRARMGGTGRGLVFRDSCSRVRQLYGAPQRQDRSLLGDKDNDLFVYRFDRGIKQSLLTLEITCDSARNEVRSLKLTASGTSKP